MITSYRKYQTLHQSQADVHRKKQASLLPSDNPFLIKTGPKLFSCASCFRRDANISDAKAILVLRFLTWVVAVDCGSPELEMVLTSRAVGPFSTVASAAQNLIHPST